MIPESWKGTPCGNHCTKKFSALTRIPWRVYCKKGCDMDSETWEECLEECNELCYKNPVLEGQQWSAMIDRSPGATGYSEECFYACASGCGHQFEVESEKVSRARPNTPLQGIESPPTAGPGTPTKDVRGSSAK